MHSKKILLIFWTSLALAGDFSGKSALSFTEKAVSFGPRPAGSAAIEKLRGYVLAQLKPYGCEVTQDVFTAQTPAGAVVMKNIIARFAGKSGRAVAFTGHYDTKVFPGIRFVGANDAGSSTGLLLEVARALAGKPRKDDVYLVWFDGEEAVAEWSSTDGLYGSRHLAGQWAADNTARRLKALINVDMIGDKNLEILQEASSSPALTKLVWQTAAELGYGSHFPSAQMAIDDDHMPFVRMGVPALDLIDFDYGPGHSWWHNEKDTMDKLSPQSLQIVGDVLIEALRRLEAQ
jgi:Zn-dependent M28 family amino/carboxypeptidase